ncbi:hypothetical protein CRYUN_Cryun14cG0128100 [Craigia yunnanensis]
MCALLAFFTLFCIVQRRRDAKSSQLLSMRGWPMGRKWKVGKLYFRLSSWLVYPMEDKMKMVGSIWSGRFQMRVTKSSIIYIMSLMSEMEGNYGWRTEDIVI